jgi:hypothetical protein
MSTSSGKHGLDEVNIGFLSRNQEASSSLPLVITPRWNASLGFLDQWCRSNRSFIDESILKYGAILIRGFE